MSDLNAVERAVVAAAAGLNAQYLYQCMTRRRDMDPLQAALLERTSNGRVRRWDVRRDWHLIWPELIGTAGAPPVGSAARHAA